MTVLDDILVATRRRLEEARRRTPLAEVQKAAARRAERRDFAAALTTGRLDVIAELKQASPSGGLLRTDYRCREIAEGYEAAGASALSVLTEPRYFKGALDDLTTARRATRLPALRKDFILDEYQVYESVAAGADAVLLIVAALQKQELRALIRLADELSIAPLVEAHTAEEVDRALEAGAYVVGVNNRDLKTLRVDVEASFRLRARIPSGCVTVSESGIKTGDDLRRLHEAGFNAALVGEHCLRSPDPGRGLAAMLENAKLEVRNSKIELSQD